MDNNKKNKQKLFIWLHIITISFALMGALNTGALIFDKNIIKSVFGNYSKYIFILIGLSGLYLLLQRDSFLPFLGHNVIPTSFKKDIPTQQNTTTPNVNISIDIPEEDNWTHIIYWAANPKKNEGSSSTTPMSWQEAYGNYENTAILPISKLQKTIVVSLNCPQEYNVNTIFNTKLLPKHFHYRFVDANGYMSRIYTKNIIC
jgi:uncharacterized membrane protein YuzA (DUF378 family)